MNGKDEIDIDPVRLKAIIATALLPLTWEIERIARQIEAIKKERAETAANISRW